MEAIGDWIGVGWVGEVHFMADNLRVCLDETFDDDI